MAGADVALSAHASHRLAVTLIFGGAAAFLVASRALPWGRLLRTTGGATLLLAQAGVVAALLSVGVWATGGRASELWAGYLVVIPVVGWCFDAVTDAVFTVLTGGA